MICDDCKYRDKCNKIISESATYCVDKGKAKKVLTLANDNSLVYYGSDTSLSKDITEMSQILENLLQRGW